MKLRTLFLLGASVMAFGSVAKAESLTVWVIDGDTEKPYFTQLETRYNESQSENTVDIVPIPGYNQALQAATLSNDLPDVMLVDGPNMASLVWAGTLQPLDGLLDPEIKKDLLPGIVAQGTYGPDGKFYQIGPYESSAVLWGNKKLLDEAGIKIPASVDEAWTADQLGEVLGKLKALPEVEWPLDMKLNYGAGEWLTYGFSPFVQSNGGDIIDRTTWTADGTLNSDGNVAVMQRLSDWVNDGYIVPASAGDNKFYGEKTAALAWVGNWMWPAHEQGLGDDLVLIPPPSLGEKGPVSPNGGWGWSVPSTTTKLDAVSSFLDFAMSPEQVALYADITGYIPSRVSAVPLSKLYASGGEGALFVDVANCCSIVRPIHPAYPVISTAWATAADNIMTGKADVRDELDTAAEEIDEDIEDNAGYPPFGQ